MISWVKYIRCIHILWSFPQTTHFLWPSGVEADGRLIDFGLFISSFEFESHLALGGKKSGTLRSYTHIRCTPYTKFCEKMSKFNSWYCIKKKLSNNNIQVVCTLLICVQFICKTATFYLENCRRSNPFYRGTLWQPPARHSHHFDNRIFPLENLVNKTTTIYTDYKLPSKLKSV